MRAEVRIIMFCLDVWQISISFEIIPLFNRFIQEVLDLEESFFKAPQPPRIYGYYI